MLTRWRTPYISCRIHGWAFTDVDLFVGTKKSGPLAQGGSRLLLAQLRRAIAHRTAKSDLGSESAFAVGARLSAPSRALASERIPYSNARRMQLLCAAPA